MLFWFCLWGVQGTETFLLLQSTQDQVHAATLDREIADTQASLQRLASNPGAATEPDSDNPQATTTSSFNPFKFFVHKNDDLQHRLQQLQTEREAMTTSVQTAHSVLYAVVTVLPKTSGTTEILSRALTTNDDKQAINAIQVDNDDRRPHRESLAERKAVRTAMAEKRKQANRDLVHRHVAGV